MDSVLMTFNLTGSVVLALLAMIPVFHPRIHEGLLACIGLAMLATGLFVLAWHLPGLTVALEPEHRAIPRALACAIAGAYLCLMALAWRVWQDPRMRDAAARVTGWGDLDHV